MLAREDEASFVRECAPWRCGISFLVRVAGIVQVA